jgi:diguanylate cyclase (GGDEF)-like protein/PAS domain S-box-containing protein
MANTPRSRFILLTTAAYAAFSLVWIFLSDELLASFSDVGAMQWLSTAKGIFYVTVSTAIFMMALRSVPPEGANTWGTPAFGPSPLPYSIWISYFFAVALPVSLLVIGSHLLIEVDSRPMMVMLMLPIIVSALLGGLWPGALATAISALGIAYFGLPPLHSLAIDNGIDRLQWAFLIANGLAVSLLSEKLRKTLANADAQRTLLNAVVSGTSDAVFVKDTDGRYLLINEAGARMVGKPVVEIVGKTDSDLFPPESAKLLIETDRAIMASGKNQTHEESLTMQNGAGFVFLVTKGPITDAHGQVSGLFGVSHDITTRKTAELGLREAATLFESSYEGIMVVSPDRKITKVNPAFIRITGYTAEEAVGESPRLLSSGRHDSGFYAGMWQTLEQDGVWRGEIWNRRKDGEIYAELLSISVVRGAAGAVQHYIGVFWDITQIKAHEAELDHVAHYDPLTGSPNRRLLTGRLDQAIEHAQRSHHTLAVCLLDLDGFKLINDRHGQTTGDHMLIGVANNLKLVLRDDDTLARLGGDEFVLLLSNLSSAEDIALILERVQNAIAKPVNIDGELLSVSASIGVSLYPQDNSSPDALLRHAEQAMFLAKEAGKNRYQLFDPESDRQAQLHRTQLDQLDAALQNNEFVLYYQPKVDLLSGQIVGVEALIRWQHPQRGLLSPAEFLPAIDGSALEKPFGEWVIKTALAQASTWLGTGLSIRVSVNVSARHLLQADFQSHLKQALQDRAEVNPAQFELEVLESAAIDDIDLAVTTLQQCRTLGVHFSLDDFGTGYSSLTHLRKLPVDTLKIDQSFVRGMLDNPDDLGIVEGVIRLAGAFRRQVIAEGVETLAHGAALVKLGCRLAQGYGIARPMPAEQFPAWCEQWKQQQKWHDLSN